LDFDNFWILTVEALKKKEIARPGYLQKVSTISPPTVFSGLRPTQ